MCSRPKAFRNDRANCEIYILGVVQILADAIFRYACLLARRRQ